MNPYNTDDREHIDGTELCDVCGETCEYTADVVTMNGEVSLCEECFTSVSPAEAAEAALGGS